MILLAAGNSVRFGSNKLLYPINGKPLYQFLPDTLAAVERCDGVHCIVSQYEEIFCQMSERGYHCVKNSKPEEGISYSIRLGIEYLEQLGVLLKEDAILFGVCDQPYVQAKTIEDLLGAYRESKKGLGCLCKEGTLGNPAVFSAAYVHELKSLAKDQGGKKVIHRHLDDLCRWEVRSLLELEDIDCKEALELVRKKQGLQERAMLFCVPESRKFYGRERHSMRELIKQTGLSEFGKATIALVGAGGKTTFAYELAKAFRAEGKQVLVSTTTHMRASEEYCYLWREEIPTEIQLEELRRHIESGNVWTAGRKAKAGKIQSLPEKALEALREQELILILEADGAKERLIKMPADHEPVIPKKTDLVIGVTSWLAIGQPVKTAHRMELVKAFLEKSEEAVLTEEDVFQIMTNRKGLKKYVTGAFWPVLNRCPKCWYPKEKQQWAEQGIILCEEME